MVAQRVKTEWEFTLFKQPEVKKTQSVIDGGGDSPHKVRNTGGKLNSGDSIHPTANCNLSVQTKLASTPRELHWLHFSS